MDEKGNSTEIFNPPTREHLAPLSAYSRMVMCDQIRGPQSQKESADPFVNFKVELINDNWGKKRPIDCDVEDDFSSPCKKQCIPNVVSPDLGCFMDYSSSLTRNNSMSPFVPPFPKPNQKTETDRSEIKETVSSRLELEHVERGCTKKKAKTENTLINSSSDFDQDVEDILCLNLLKEEEVQGPADEEKPATRAVEDDKVSVSPALCQHFPFLIQDSSETVNGSLLAPLKLDFLEGDDEVLNIGQPMFESSICQPAAATEPEAERSEAPRETYNSEDCTGDSLNETTLPINVQVRSKVVAVGHAERISQPASSMHSQQAVRRPLILDRTIEWERQKEHYIFFVKSHMDENPSRASGAVNELQDLMTHVAGQSRDSQWQHPSDLTCRNYQKRFGNRRRTMTLSEWQDLNKPHYKRFLNVPRIFHRSHF